MLNFEANSTVVNLFQAHSFEDRVLKKAPVHIRENATVRAGVVMLYGADIGQGAIVTEQSVIMKNELLLPDRYYCGAPTQS
jgi:acetyltransferase-like isoleucine patch superfamily enzyme